MTDLDNKLYALLDQMREQEIKKAQDEGRDYHIHGLCAVLGYDPDKHYSYFTIPGIDNFRVGKDYFDQLPGDIDHNIRLGSPEALNALYRGMEEDGAILIDKKGKFLHSGKYMLPDLKNLNSNYPHAVATYRRINKTADGGTRHLNAIALSAELPMLRFYLLKSDHPDLRVIQGGRLRRSSIPGEMLEQLEQAPNI